MIRVALTRPDLNMKKLPILILISGALLYSIYYWQFAHALAEPHLRLHVLSLPNLKTMAENDTRVDSDTECWYPGSGINFLGISHGSLNRFALSDDWKYTKMPDPLEGEARAAALLQSPVGGKAFLYPGQDTITVGRGGRQVFSFLSPLPKGTRTGGSEFLSLFYNNDQSLALYDKKGTLYVIKNIFQPTAIKYEHVEGLQQVFGGDNLNELFVMGTDAKQQIYLLKLAADCNSISTKLPIQKQESAVFPLSPATFDPSSKMIFFDSHCQYFIVDGRTMHLRAKEFYPTNNGNRKFFFCGKTEGVSFAVFSDRVINLDTGMIEARLPNFKDMAAISPDHRTVVYEEEMMRTLLHGNTPLVAYDIIDKRILGRGNLEPGDHQSNANDAFKQGVFFIDDKTLVTFSGYRKDMQNNSFDAVSKN